MVEDSFADELHADDAEAGGMGPVHQPREARRIAEAPGGGEKAARLIAPGIVQRMLGDRHQLDMREAKIDDIGDQVGGKIVVGQETAVAGALP